MEYIAQDYMKQSNAYIKIQLIAIVSVRFHQKRFSPEKLIKM